MGLSRSAISINQTAAFTASYFLRDEKLEFGASAHCSESAALVLACSGAIAGSDFECPQSGQLPNRSFWPSLPN